MTVENFGCNNLDEEIINFMISRGFEYTDDLGNGLMSSHKNFVSKDKGMVFYASQAEFIYAEMNKARIAELEMARSVWTVKTVAQLARWFRDRINSLKEGPQ